MKTFSRLVTLGAVASGVGGVLFAVGAPTASASPTVSASNTMVTSPESVTITAHVDPLNTAQLYFDGSQVRSLTNPVQTGSTLSYTFNSGAVGNGTYPVELKEKTGGLSPLTQTASSTVTVRIPPAQPAHSASSGSGSQASSSGAAGSGGSAGGAGSAGNGGAAPAPAGIGYMPPGSGGTGFGSAYSRMDSMSGRSALVLPDVVPQNGFQLPVKAAPKHQAQLADSPSRGNSLTAATWLIGLALGFIMLLTAAHTGAWARRRHLQNAPARIRTAGRRRIQPAAAARRR